MVLSTSFVATEPRLYRSALPRPGMTVPSRYSLAANSISSPAQYRQCSMPRAGRRDPMMLRRRSHLTERYRSTRVDKKRSHPLSLASVAQSRCLREASLRGRLLHRLTQRITTASTCVTPSVLSQGASVCTAPGLQTRPPALSDLVSIPGATTHFHGQAVRRSKVLIAQEPPHDRQARIAQCLAVPS